MSFLSSPAPATPDPLNPVFKAVPGPFREQFPEQDHSRDPSPAYSEEERRQLLAEGKDLFFSRTAFGQQPSQGPLVFDQAVSCATCHDPALGFADGLTHLVGPVREREVARRQSPSLLGVDAHRPLRVGRAQPDPPGPGPGRHRLAPGDELLPGTDPTGAGRPGGVPGHPGRAQGRAGKEYDPARAARGEALFRTPRPVTDATGEFPAGAMVACATCHSGPFFTDGKAHRSVVVTGDPARSTPVRSPPTAPSSGSTPRRCSGSGSRRRTSTTAASGTPRLPAISSPGGSAAIPSTGTSAGTEPRSPGGPCSTTSSPSTTPSASTSGSPTMSWPTSPSSSSPSKIGPMRTLRLLLPLALVTQVFVAGPAEASPSSFVAAHDRRGGAARSQARRAPRARRGSWPTRTPGRSATS